MADREINARVHALSAISTSVFIGCSCSRPSASHHELLPCSLLPRTWSSTAATIALSRLAKGILCGEDCVGLRVAQSVVMGTQGLRVVARVHSGKVVRG